MLVDAVNFVINTIETTTAPIKTEGLFIEAEISIGVVSSEAGGVVIKENTSSV